MKLNQVILSLWLVLFAVVPVLADVNVVGLEAPPDVSAVDAGYGEFDLQGKTVLWNDEFIGFKKDDINQVYFNYGATYDVSKSAWVSAGRIEIRARSLDRDICSQISNDYRPFFEKLKGGNTEGVLFYANGIVLGNKNHLGESISFNREGTPFSCMARASILVDKSSFDVYQQMFRDWNDAQGGLSLLGEWDNGRNIESLYIRK